MRQPLFTASFAIRASLLVSLCVFANSCGASVAEHDDFRKIQRAEAKADTGLEHATDNTRSCDERCDGEDATCRSSDVVCEVADDTDDRDALARCDRTKRQCESAKLRARSACEC